MRPEIVSPSMDDGNNHSSLKKDLSEASDKSGNLPPEHDADKNNAENDYENLDPIYEELSEISNSAKRKQIFLFKL